MDVLIKIYRVLLKDYAEQGWWPLLDVARSFSGKNPTKTGSISGYHPGDYSFPKDEKQRFEICVGAVLTQNTAWPNVEKALKNLYDEGLIDPERILGSDKIKDLIRPAGYFNQKAAYLKNLSEFLIKNKSFSRDELLGVRGIGEETADSILLYAYKRCEFVVDAYTRRVFSNLGLIDEKMKYGDIKKMFEDALPRDLKIYQEYHALIVEHVKRFYSRKQGDGRYNIMDPYLQKLINKPG